MFAQRGVVTAQFESICVVLAVLHRRIGMCALGAPELDDDAIALLTGHGVPR